MNKVADSFTLMYGSIDSFTLMYSSILLLEDGNYFFFFSRQAEFYLSKHTLATAECSKKNK